MRFRKEGEMQVMRAIPVKAADGSDKKFGRRRRYPDQLPKLPAGLSRYNEDAGTTADLHCGGNGEHLLGER